MSTIMFQDVFEIFFYTGVMLKESLNFFLNFCDNCLHAFPWDFFLCFFPLVFLDSKRS